MTRYDDISIRMKMTALLFIFVFTYLGIHLYSVQIIRHDELYAKAKNKYTAVKTATGKRGEIYDSDGNLLVGNVPCSDICADPQIVGNAEECRRIAAHFGKALKIEPERIYNRLIAKTYTTKNEEGIDVEVPRKFAVIETKVDFEVSEQLKKDCETMKFKGISFRDTTKRIYPKNQLLANILGFTNIDKDKAVAVIGIEKFFNQPISSSSGISEYERARDGIPLSYGKSDVIKDVKDGLNIYLTVREPIQAILEEELDNLVAKFNPRAAYAIMADPYTGNIIAVAQRPTFNPNERKAMNPDAWRNRITEDIFEPGSTMKPFAISGALDMGVVGPDTRFDCEKGRWLFGGKILRDSHPLGMLTVSEIIQKSSNIGTAKIALLMGDKNVYDILKKFGFGEKTGIPLQPETSGIFRPLKRWDTLSISRFPIGQGIAVSPLQLVRAYCALANGGHLPKLRIVDRIENPGTGIVRHYPIPDTVSIFKNGDTHKKMVEMMKKVTEEGGTAVSADVKGYYVAGKTGTSQKFINGAYSQSQFFATFVGFVPADKPSFVLLVTADEPQGSHFGGTVAGPYFKAISERTLKYLNVPQDYIPEEEPSKKVKVASAKASH